jgi:hypothetical protein
MKVTEDVSEAEKQIGRFKVQPAVILLVHETKRVAKRVYSDHVTCECFKYVVHLHDLTRLARQLHARKHLGHVFFHDRLKSADTGTREEGGKGVAAPTVQVVVYGGHDGVGGWRIGN